MIRNLGCGGCVRLPFEPTGDRPRSEPRVSRADALQAWRDGNVAKRKWVQLRPYCFEEAFIRFVSSSRETSSLCVAIHQTLPDASFTPALRSP